ncbi:hypothetical protein OROGR_024053 [Orobanche gracilis]
MSDIILNLTILVNDRTQILELIRAGYNLISYPNLYCFLVVLTTEVTPQILGLRPTHTQAQRF